MKSTFIAVVACAAAVQAFPSIARHVAEQNAKRQSIPTTPFPSIGGVPRVPGSVPFDEPAQFVSTSGAHAVRNVSFSPDSLVAFFSAAPFRSGKTPDRLARTRSSCSSAQRSPSSDPSIWKPPHFLLLPSIAAALLASASRIGIAHRIPSTLAASISSNGKTAENASLCPPIFPNTFDHFSISSTVIAPPPRLVDTSLLTIALYRSLADLMFFRSLVHRPHRDRSTRTLPGTQRRRQPRLPSPRRYRYLREHQHRFVSFHHVFVSTFPDVNYFAGLFEAFGLGRDSTQLLQQTTAFFDGDILASKWSIGTFSTKTYFGGGVLSSLGQQSGICK